MNTCCSFSVLMAVYYKDDPGLLRMAIDSIFANKLKPTTLVLVQDGPVGRDLSGLISRYQERQDFFLIKLPNNKGLANALNVGLKHITTPFVFRADADDYNLPDRFEKQIGLLKSGYDLVGGVIREIDRIGNSLAIRTVPTSQNQIRQLMSKRCPFNHMTVAYRRSVVVELGGYPDIFLKEDYALWALMFSSGAKMTNIDEILVNATAGPDMYKRRGGIKYVYSEIHMQKFLIKLGLQSSLGAIFIGLSRSMVFLMPVFLRAFIYEKFLRKNF
jgi:glycosyltransferase involved in cell wall biosynthesis